MSQMQPEIIQHMIEASEPTRYSVLLRDPEQVSSFVRWCQRSYVASDIFREREEQIHTFVIDPDEQVYCLALSVDTLGELVKDLAAEYEEERLREFLSR
jgi:hypothetical protein